MTIQRIFFVLSLFIIFINSQQIYVNPNIGIDNSTCGSFTAPCKTIQYSIDISNSNYSQIYLQSATYHLQNALQVESKKSLQIYSNGTVSIEAENGFINSSNSGINFHNVTVFTNSSFLFKSKNNLFTNLCDFTLLNREFSEDAIHLDSSTFTIYRMNIVNNLSLSGSFLKSINSISGLFNVTGKNVTMLSSFPFADGTGGSLWYRGLYFETMRLNNLPLMRSENASTSYIESSIKNIENASSIYQQSNSPIRINNVVFGDLKCKQPAMINATKVNDLIDISYLQIKSLNVPLLPLNFAANHNVSMKIYKCNITAKDFSVNSPLLSFDSSHFLNISIDLSQFSNFKSGVLKFTPNSLENMNNTLPSQQHCRQRVFHLHPIFSTSKNESPFVQSEAVRQPSNAGWRSIVHLRWISKH